MQYENNQEIDISDAFVNVTSSCDKRPRDLTVTRESLMMESSNRSPRIIDVSWGRLEVEGEPEPYKDAKLFPGGSREWNWRETGTASQARHSNCRCAGIAGARLESRRALAWNGRVPSRAARDAGFFEGTANSCARIADAACCGALQQARANRGGWRLVPYDVLMTSCAHNSICVRRDTLSRAPSAARLISSSDAGFSNADVSPSFSPRYAARTMRRMTLAFRVLGMSPTNKTSLGASALPSWAANAFSKL